mmetsp:Transcript_56302/g.134208  ORF Transcript_56302/g.134208 Transcript_56302/m.134208 type:complete len:205 (-) Transcript_56302:234-848(-)
MHFISLGGSGCATILSGVGCAGRARTTAGCLFSAVPLATRLAACPSASASSRLASAAARLCRASELASEAAVPLTAVPLGTKLISASGINGGSSSLSGAAASPLIRAGLASPPLASGSGCSSSSTSSITSACSRSDVKETAESSACALSAPSAASSSASRSSTISVRMVSWLCGFRQAKSALALTMSSRQFSFMWLAGSHVASS